MENINGCQLPCLSGISEGKAEFGPQPIKQRIKRMLAKTWNYSIKKNLKRIYSKRKTISSNTFPEANSSSKLSKDVKMDHLRAGDLVHVRSLREIQDTLNPFKELKGCAFLEEMKQYCDTQQRVFMIMERFLDERDYEVKKVKGIVLLEGIFCQGTPVFGRCDRSCLLFWREEWLEKIPAVSV